MVFLFALGTLPVLLIFGAINSIISRKYVTKIAKIGVVLVFILPKLNIDKQLKEGENTIEFIPSETGDIQYTCGIGMIKK